MLDGLWVQVPAIVGEKPLPTLTSRFRSALATTQLASTTRRCEASLVSAAHLTWSRQTRQRAASYKLRSMQARFKPIMPLVTPVPEARPSPTQKQEFAIDPGVFSRRLSTRTHRLSYRHVASTCHVIGAAGIDGGDEPPNH
ncbi:hypothetical protein C0Q70_00430 [Pomacea canaliculata]|uniref:Uncharacterized protein n=1 Tax=Pomacea canaliculata TaxID=400727 RepID=A0A2T7PWR1_POMCA|nr:hypothetical protein C0Q70_00430 [Pomacea canaliculata]